jgi:hypothetical protein
MTDEEYAFFLAYGMTQEDESLNSLLDVKMYNILNTDSSAAFEACDSSVLCGDTSEAKATRVKF